MLRKAPELYQQGPVDRPEMRLKLKIEMTQTTALETTDVTPTNSQPCFTKPCPMSLRRYISQSDHLKPLYNHAPDLTAYAILKSIESTIRLVRAGTIVGTSD